MILEIAILNVASDKVKDFEKDFAEAQKIISSMGGYVSHSLKKSSDYPNRYLLMVKWQKLEDHQIGFRKSEQYQVWKKMLHHYYNPVPKVEYYNDESIFP